MNYVEHSLEIYNSLINSDEAEIDSNTSRNYKSIIQLISKNISDGQLQNQYQNEIESILASNLSIFKNDLEIAHELKNVSYYGRSVGIYTTFLIFWITYNGVELSREELSKLSEAIFLGTIGYRLFDAHYDENLMGREVPFIGNYLIHKGEEILLNVFDFENTFKIINKYVGLYSEVEFLEKRYRWRPCVFSWNEPEKLAFKGAPMLMIAELIFKKAKLEETKIKYLIDGLGYAFSALQLADDISDAEDDLSHGTETLVMSGFYEKYGTETKINNEMIKNFLDDQRILKFYDTAQSLFDKARKIFSENDDDILLLFLEFQNYEFNSAFNPNK